MTPMDDQHIHDEHDAMEAWEAQYDEAAKSREWPEATQEEKELILLKIIRKAPRRMVPTDDTQALKLCGRIILHYAR